MKNEKASKRLKLVRIFTGLSIKDFCEKHDLKMGTHLKQESGHLLISQKAAEQIVSAARKEDVLCSADWILEGRGGFPKMLRENVWRKLSTD